MRVPIFLAPLAVAPERQGQGVGTQLINAGVAQLERIGVSLVFVYGDPGYYGKFEFSADAATGFLPPYELEFPFGWQLRILQDGADTPKQAKLACVDALSDPALW